MKRGVLATTAAVLIVVAVVSVLYARSVQEHRYPVRMLDRATSLAQEIPLPEPRVRALVAVAESALQCDDRERAEQLLRQAGAYLVAIDEPVSRHAASALTVSAMLRAGLKDEATQVVHGVSHDEVGRLLQDCIAQQTPASKEMDALMTMVKGVEDAEQVVREQCLGAGFLAEVAPEAFGRESKNASDMVLWTTGRFLLEAGKAEDALKVARLCKDEGTRARALAEVALQLAQGGRSDEADSLFREAVALATAVMRKGEKAEDPPGYSLQEVVVALVEAGKYRQAMDIVEREGLKSRLNTTARIACILARKRNFEDALRLVRSLPPQDKWREAMVCIGKEMVTVGRLEEARQLAMQLSDAGSPVLIEICVVKAKAGKLEEAIQIAREAEEPVRSDAMRAIAQELSNLGYLADALYVARSIHAANQRDDALSIIAVHLARALNFSEAERVLKEVQRNEARYSAQCRVAEEMARAGKPGDAERMFSLPVRTARGIDDRTERSRALSWIASSMAGTAVTWRAHQRYH